MSAQQPKNNKPGFIAGNIATGLIGGLVMNGAAIDQNDKTDLGNPQIVNEDLQLALAFFTAQANQAADVARTLPSNSPMLADAAKVIRVNRAGQLAVKRLLLEGGVGK